MTKPAAIRRTTSRRKSRVWAECLTGCAVLALLTFGGFVLQVNLTTISFAYLLLVMGIALYGGFWQASLISLLAAGFLDYFFTQPPFHFYMTDPKEMVALGAFEVTTIVISRLSAKELRSSRDAALQHLEMEQLYELSRSSLLLDLHQPPGSQLAILIHRVFDLRAVALYDMNLSRQDRVGDWDAGEQDLAKECYLRNSSQDDTNTQIWQRVLRAGPGPVGALVVRGELSPVVVDALGSLAALTIDRYQSFEKEERADTAKNNEQLRAAVMDALAHEFKTPLTAVQTASSGLLELGGLSEPQRNLVTLIDAEAIRMNRLCTRLLKAAKLEAREVGLETSEVNVRDLVSEVLAGHPGQAGIRFGLALLGVPIEFHDEVIGRWAAGGKRPIGEFAPYFRHMFSVDFFFQLAIAADLISRVRPAGKADNKVDIAYLYYLPFCMVFVSSDKLHERVVPLFLRDDQSFVKGQELKADLKKIDEHYAQLPRELTSQGVYKFATSPPDGVAPHVTQLWDKHLLPTWREKKDQQKERTPEDDKSVIEMIDRAQKESTLVAVDLDHPPDIDDFEFAHVSRLVIPKKGKWIRINPTDATTAD